MYEHKGLQMHQCPNWLATSNYVLNNSNYLSVTVPTLANFYWLTIAHFSAWLLANVSHDLPLMWWCSRVNLLLKLTELPELICRFSGTFNMREKKRVCCRNCWKIQHWQPELFLSHTRNFLILFSFCYSSFVTVSSTCITTNIHIHICWSTSHRIKLGLQITPKKLLHAKVFKYTAKFMPWNQCN